MRVMRLLLVTVPLALAVLAAPARGQDNLARLELARKSHPQSVAALRALGVAYYRAGRYADAMPVLEQANRINPRDGVVALYLGMSAEQTGNLSAARDAYSSYVLNGRTSRVRRELKARLAALNRRSLEEAAKAAVAREASLSAQPGPPNTIAVLPFAFHGSDSTLLPLGRGLADLMVTDLSRASQLTVLERDQVQALLNEITLSASGRVDSSTVLRTGRIMRAGRVVQGAISQIGGRTLTLDAAVVDVATTQATGTVQTQDQLDQLFDMEKKLALGLFDKLGVRLSPNELALVQQRPTRSLAAFLSYSAGLLAEDNGNLDEAERRFDDAARLDPGFSAASEKKTQVQNAKAGASMSVSTIETSILTSPEAQNVINAADRGAAVAETPPLSTTLNATANDINPSIAVQVAGTPAGTTSTTTPVSQKDPTSSATGTDQPSAVTGKIVIIIRQP